MRWLIRMMILILRTLSLISLNVAWICAVTSGCAFFQLWKSYDALWVWLHVLCTCAVPQLRYENLFLQWAFVFRRRCGDGTPCKLVLQEQRQEIMESEKKSAKFANAITLGVALLRVRVSVAIIYGEFVMRATGNRQYQKTVTGLYIRQYLFLHILLFDVAMLWFTLLVFFCHQCRLCYQLGCCRYYLWCLIIVVVGVLVMELPMYYATQRMDKSLCKLTLWPEPAQIVYNVTGTPLM